MKRALDVVLAVALIIAASPVAIVLAAAIKAGSRGPLLFRARRVGLNGREFTMLKFRTMHPEAAADGPAITRTNDPRVTRLGTWLRRSRLDELPQLVNVLAGDMSLVGPRPEDPRYVAGYTAAQRQVLAVRPGITSPASLAFRDEAALLDGVDWERRYCEEILPAKVAMELEYARQASSGRDLAIIWRTAIECARSMGETIRAAGNRAFRAAHEPLPR